MKTTKFTLLVLILAVGALSSCKKKKEEPAAPVSNVHSFTLNTTGSAWVLDGKTYKATLTVESIDADLLSNGSVNVFRGDGTGYNWVAMPASLQDVEFNYTLSLHTVEVSMFLTNDNLPPLSNPGVQQFKVVVIDGEARWAHPNVNWNDYNEVKRTFSLID